MLVNCIRPFRSQQTVTRCFATLIGIEDKTHCKGNKHDSFNVRSQTSLPRPMSFPCFRECENEFMSYLPKVLESLTENNEHLDLAFGIQRLSKLLECNVSIGDKIKGVTTVISYKMLETSKNLTKENVEMANILGWCAELMRFLKNYSESAKKIQPCFGTADIIMEDLINNSEMRKKIQSWSKLSNAGPEACLHPFILEMCIFSLLKTHFSEHLLYKPLIHFFQTVFYKTAVGRLLDCQEFKVDDININTLHRITKYKTGYDDLYVGVTLGMYLSRIYHNALHKQVTPILMNISKYYQIQKDIQDYSSNATSTGNVGRHIAEGRCTWLVVVAFKKSNQFQMQIIKNNYGRKEDESIQAILDVYQSLDILSEFRTYEEDSYKTLCNNVNKLANSSIRNLLGLIIKELYNR